ncbi:site-specific DNA-methyltransferase [Runella slithyformis]|uniref:site-specific DNA-methyltransferase (adenine-specific) n=1 Tax=Runella slithyformis (strain ATCC 29530 / DSM 19594 / LMG 11500 / NCIMB 11436 / LSU 4) TaxID=761193 RepID=A0A7U3ZG19_RUNSL|nr:site-specific DNA-methyltransferase [Runella slithyformis]AEI46562.1 Site-specific DNA-methyltransferase (adenine-specific) [Runella slithyformis DSM 19594]
MNKHDLIQKVKALEGISQDERAYLIDLINTKKKYGLVWEDKPEDVEETLRTHLPVLQEVPEKRITGFRDLQDRQDKNAVQGLRMGQDRQDLKKVSTPTLFDTVSSAQEVKIKQDFENNPSTNPVVPDNPENPVKDCFPNHTLIEGDNLHALTALTFTHENKIDVIYIDPPYNTGNKDFKYNDSFVDREDSYRHSKWLSFMDKRLRIAKRLLSDKGVIFISIDDNEQAQLKLLCDEVFGENNFIDNIIWEKNYAPRNDAKYFSAAHDFILVYKKGDWERKLDERSDAQNLPYKHDDNNGRGLYRMDNVLVKTFNQSGVFPVINPNTGKEYLPPQGSCWRYSKDTFQRMIEENRIYWGKDGKGAPQAKRYLNEVKQGTVPQTIWKYQDVGHTQDGKNELKDLDLTNRAFETPKPSKLIKKIINYDTRPNATILDFFAGSGTTLHATMALNAEDGGSRQCILVTNNENNICEEVTYERNKRVIEGYTNAKGAWVEGLGGNNLRYYRGGFVPSLKSEANKRLLTQASTELLCLKENCYHEITAEYALDPRQARIFRDDADAYMVVVYHSRQQAEVCEALVGIIQGLSSTQKIKVYGFSPEKDILVEEFYGVQDRIEAIPLPDAIYNAYKATFRIMGLDRM